MRGVFLNATFVTLSSQNSGRDALSLRNIGVFTDQRLSILRASIGLFKKENISHVLSVSHVSGLATILIEDRARSSTRIGLEQFAFDNFRQQFRRFLSTSHIQISVVGLIDFLPNNQSIFDERINPPLPWTIRRRNNSLMFVNILRGRRNSIGEK